uniref:Four and a half LIM domains protein 5 isoform X2 n=1 Tax=Phascolarctos cinereus TaxID=38626 RepID=A0A6P5L7U0_PHACI|nr:four and a half LIM domains protein 5 isoform X2 [Phascolarctos cinereus]
MKPFHELSSSVKWTILHLNSINSKMTTPTECLHCMKSIYGKEYTVKNDEAYCIPCYDLLFSSVCEKCKGTIGYYSRDFSYKDLHWHDDCFKCAKCNRSLMEKPFAVKDKVLLCTACYTNECSSKCFQCKKIIMPGSRKIEFRGNEWHASCFICQSCGQPMGKNPVMTKDSKNYCVPCFEKHFAPYCKSCKKVVSVGGMTFHNKPWHKDCFLCSRCKKKLYGENFFSRDDDPFCQDCYADLYALKCDACNEPITALGNPQYVTFQERQWHSDCFKCGKCNVSLVGQGFLTHQDTILCRECGINPESEI